MVLKLTTLLLCAVLLCSQVLLSQAQDVTATPQPQQTFIQSWDEEIIFPAAVRLTMTMNLPPEQVKSVNLTIKSDAIPPIRIPIDISANTFVGGPITGIAYVWAIPTDTPPVLFKDITIDWEATSQTNQTAKVEDKFTFLDPRAYWLRDLTITNSLKLTLPNGKAPQGTITPVYSHTGLDDLATNLKQVTDLLSKNLGNIPGFNFLINDTKLLCTKNTNGELVAIGPTSNTEVPCSNDTASKIFAASGFTPINLSNSALDNVQSAVSRLIVQQAYASHWSGKNVPQWFQSGLIEFYAPDSKAQLKGAALIASRSNSLLSLDVMAKAPTANVNADLWRSESYGLVVYIASQIGVSNLFKLASDAGNTASFAQAYQTATGKSIDTLLVSFGRWLFTDTASGAFTFTVYQAPTPSPTPSRTATVTRTPIPTATDTPTPTATVTGELTNTPLPTHTQTPAPTTAPASNTPRPAGSLNTLTPTPPFNTTVSNNTLNVGVIILALGAIIVVVAAVILFRPKR